MSNDLMTPRQVAEFMKLSRSTVSRMISEHEIPAIALRSGKRSTCYRIARPDLDKFLSDRATLTVRRGKKSA